MTEPQPFRSLPECLLCEYYTCNLHLRCAVHPMGVEWDDCPDYTPVRQSPPPEEPLPPSKALLDRGIWVRPKRSIE